MLFGDMTEGSYNFLVGSEVDACSKSFQTVLSILTLQRVKMCICLLKAIVLEQLTFFTYSVTNAFLIFCMYLQDLILEI
jgi:hypothetical protein